jgi:hypothetical protein
MPVYNRRDVWWNLARVPQDAKAMRIWKRPRPKPNAKATVTESDDALRSLTG